MWGLKIKTKFTQEEIEKHNRDISAATYRIEHRLDNHKEEAPTDEE